LLWDRAVYARKHIKDKNFHNSYLTVAEPFLQKYAKRSLKNQRLVGAAGSAVSIEQFLAVPGDRSDDEEETATVEESTKIASAIDQKTAKPVKGKGMLVFFPGKPTISVAR
jgi:hypothetical protein